MVEPFEYDVFLSFSSADEAVVKPVWQELGSNGLRVFWSDATLKTEVGNSWFELIEKSLVGSKHMLLFCSENSMNSKWVQREYRAFFDYCYSPGFRRLIPILTNGFRPKDLPIFLRELQVGKVNDPQFMRGLIPLLGGVNIEAMQRENQSLRQQVNHLQIEKMQLKEALQAARNVDNTIGTEQAAKLLEENKLLNETLNGAQSRIKDLETRNNDLLKQTDRIGQDSTRIIAEIMRADLCFLIYLTNNNDLRITRGYDLIREEYLEGAIVNKSLVPTLANAIQRGRPLRLPSTSTSPDIRGLSDLIGLTNPGHLLNVPIMTPEQNVLGSILVLSPYSNRLWGAEDQVFLTKLVGSLVSVFQGGR